MKRLLLSAALAATLAPNAFGQVYEVPQIAQSGGDGDLVFANLYYVPDHDGDVIALGQRIDFSQSDDLTSAASILSESELKARGQQNVSDLLRALPGIAVNSSGPAGGLTQIRVRGSEANHVLVLIDGVEVANPNSGEFDFAGLRASDIVRIETLRGEQSALYGSDAIGGVINIITRASGRELQRNLWRASAEGGSFGTLEGQISGIVQAGPVNLSLNGTAFSTDGYDISGLDGERDGSSTKTINIGFRGLGIADAAISGKYSNSTLETEFDSDSDFDGLLNNTDDRSRIKTQTARLDTKFYHAGIDHLISSHWLKTDTDTASSFDSRTVGERFNASWAAKKYFNSHSFTVLGEAEQETYDFVSADLESDDNQTFALAGDYKYAGQSPINFTASARYDINDLFSDAVTWRIGAGYSFKEYGARVYGSVGTGIKNPSLIELFGFNPGINFIGNPDLEPEESLGFSLGYAQEIGNFNFSVDYFNSKLENEIVTIFGDFQSAPPFARLTDDTVGNLATDSNREGVEVEARWKLSNQLSLRGSATFLESDQDGTKEVRRPEFLASASATYRPAHWVSVTATAEHNGEQQDTDFGTFQSVTLDSYTLIGLNAIFDLNKDHAITLRGSNLLDEDYQEVFGFASQGRGLFVGFNSKF